MVSCLAVGVALAVPIGPFAGAAPTGTPSAAVSGADAVVPGADWVVEAPELHGMSSATLDAARTYAFAAGRNTQGVVVVRDGVIVSEWYAPGSSASSWAASWSMAKSFTSSLIGIAIAQGRIPSIDVPMTTYYPDWAGTPRASITLRDVLHMESGLDWQEDYDPTSLGSSQIINMVALQSDQLAYAAGRPAAHPPGTWFNYSSGDAMLLSGVLQQATGMSVEAYAHQVLLGQIGIGPFEWWQDAAGHTLTYCCVDTTSRDFARFGLLYLRDGLWGGQQVVPASWVHDSITDTAHSYSGYGYQWWLDLGGSGSIPPYYSARGHDGQYIYVIPSLDLVVVRNGTYVKSPCPPVANPALLPYYPPSGLVPGQGTTPPDSWSDEQFLGPIVASITGAPGASATAARSAAPPASSEGAAADATSATAGATDADPAPCPAPPVTPTTTTPTTTPPSTPTPDAAAAVLTAVPATSVAATPAFTG